MLPPPVNMSWCFVLSGIPYTSEWWWPSSWVNDQMTLLGDGFVNLVVFFMLANIQLTSVWAHEYVSYFFQFSVLNQLWGLNLEDCCYHHWSCRGFIWGHFESHSWTACHHPYWCDRSKKGESPSHLSSLSQGWGCIGLLGYIIYAMHLFDLTNAQAAQIFNN